MSPIPTFPFHADELRGKKIHFVGIGGCGMSGLARLLSQLGAEVAGTDTTQSAITESLISDGIVISFEQDGHSIDPSSAAIVASAAIPEEHPEILLGEEFFKPEILQFNLGLSIFSVLFDIKIESFLKRNK